MTIDLHTITVRQLERLVASGLVTVEALRGVTPTLDGIDPWGMTLDDLAAITKGTTPKVLQDWLDAAAEDAGTYVARLNGWREWLKAFNDLLGAMAVPQTPAGRYAMQGQPDYTAEESMLLFARDYFGLQDFTASGAVTVGDYYLARKGDYGRRLAEYRAGEWQKKQADKGRKRRRV